MRSGWSEGRLGVLAPVSEPLGPGSPRAPQAAGVGRSRALRFRTCQAQGWPRPSPGPGTAPAGRPWCGTPGRPLPPGPKRRPAPEARGKGAQPSTWRGAVRRTWGPLGARLWAVSTGAARVPDPETHRAAACPPPQPGPPRASSPGLRAASSRALRPRLGLARLGSVRFGSPREEPPGLRLARGGASGSALIGQGAGVEERVPAAASAARRVPRGLK